MPKQFENNIYLFCWWPKTAFLNYVRSECSPEDVARIGIISSSWDESHKVFLELCKTTRFLGKSIEIRDIPEKFANRINSIMRKDSFRATFNQLPIDFKIVEIDKLIAPQNFIDADRVDMIIQKYSSKLDMDSLITICLDTDELVPSTSEIVTPKYSIYTSKSPNLRFLGSVPASLDLLEQNHITVGGTPAKAVMLIFGYGATPINVLSYDGRMFLNNGFHRVYALRKLGVTHIPVIVQKVTNPQFEMPKTYNNMLLDYLLTADRLPLVQDFFNADLTISLKAKPKRKVLKVSWEIEDITVPI